MEISLQKQFFKKGIALFFADVSITLLTPILSLILCLDEIVGWQRHVHPLLGFIAIASLTKLVSLYAFSIYRYAWRYAGARELSRIVYSLGIASVISSLSFIGLYNPRFVGLDELPQSLPVLDVLLSLSCILGLRLWLRAQSRRKPSEKTTQRARTLIVGAGEAGVALAHAAWRDSSLKLRPIAFVDDDPSKQNLQLRGVNVLGTCQQIPLIVRQEEIEKIVIAMPTAPGAVIRDIAQKGKALEIPTVTLPGMQEILSGKGTVAQTREIRLEDLLRRDPIETDVDEVHAFLAQKRILVTGAGGSIGSEVCRQILQAQPAEIILLGKGENSIFLIQQELTQTIQQLQAEGRLTKPPVLHAIITDIRNRQRLEYAFEQHCPQVIFHAAAHKHVPLMEMNPPEAITANVIGTKNLVDLAVQHDIQYFVMISTDKAVNPTNVMGASKRMAETVVLQAANRYQRAYNVVRFGNVLGSRGSVVPTFQKQIAAGGPITVTHPEICRYFMTIPEAVQLVLQTSVLGKGGAVFMMDMGQPVKIVDMAKDLIELAGLEVGKDIEIHYSGLRPGEKLYEELFVDGEVYERTRHHMLLTVPNASRQLPTGLDRTLLKLIVASTRHDYQTIVSLLKSNVTGYRPQPNGLGSYIKDAVSPVQESSEGEVIDPAGQSVNSGPNNLPQDQGADGASLFAQSKA